MSSKGRSLLLHLAASMVDTTSMPATTRPNTVCLLSNQGHGTVVMKNCDPATTKGTRIVNLGMACQTLPRCIPFVFGPPFAILTVKGRSWRKLWWNSSSNSPPQMLSPPVPSPAQHTHNAAATSEYSV